MDFSNGIPSRCTTLVAVPSMLFTAQNVDQLCEALEVRFLANRDANLRYCLLTDLADAPTETTDADNALIERACANRSEAHTSELQSLMRISYAVFCLNKTTCNKTHQSYNT